jgi:hypothetical protein
MAERERTVGRGDQSGSCNLVITTYGAATVALLGSRVDTRGWMSHRVRIAGHDRYFWEVCESLEVVALGQMIQGETM